MAGVAGLSRHPDAATFAAGRLADQSALVLTRYGRRMHLNELAIAIAGPGLIAARGSASGADDRHRRFAKDQAVAAGSNHHCIAAEGANLPRPHVLCDDPHALRTGPSIVNHRPEEFPKFIFVNAP